MKPFLMGEEVEYAMTGSQLGRRLPGEQIHDYLLRGLQRRYRYLPDICSERGLFLENSMRYYLDSGAHNELCSPEVNTPREMAVYDKAGERMLLETARSAMERSSGLKLAVTKYNIDLHLPDQIAWGNHESYVSWRGLSEAATQLTSHVVTRIPYAGAGWLSGYSGGEGFELSQRARHLQCAVGGETTRNRAVFCTRIRKESDLSQRGWKRAHLIAKDSQRSPFGTYLTFGVTGVLFLLLNDGYRIGRDLQLEDPVAAFRQVSADYRLQSKLLLKNGRQLTPLEIQRIYLERAEPLIRNGDYPGWTSEVLEHWGCTLNKLERDPIRLARRLDTYLKLAIFNRQVRREHLDWQDVKRALRVLQELRRQFPQPIMTALIDEQDKGLSPDNRAMLKQAREYPGLQDTTLDILRFVVRLQALELQYHELGGLYDQLEKQGQVDSVVVEEKDIRRAMSEAPRGARAEQRAHCVKTLANGSQSLWRCDWNLVINQSSGQVIDLRDPFSSERKETTLQKLDEDPAFFRNPISRLTRLLGQ